MGPLVEGVEEGGDTQAIRDMNSYHTARHGQIRWNTFPDSKLHT